MFLQIGGAVTSAVGSYYSSLNQKRNLEFQAELAKINARLAESSAQSILLQGQQQIGALTLSAGQLKGRQRASLAANGVSLGEGNAAEIQASTDIMKTIDANTLEANAVRSAWGARSEATNYQIEALSAKASASGINPFASFATSLLGSAGSVAQSWYQQSKG